MDRTLVVVESPAKAKAIEGCLGEGHVVRAAYGHGLPPSELIGAMEHADTLLLATDFDRYGEVTGYHLATLLGNDPAEAGG
jgi:DNA topoisomerase-1